MKANPVKRALHEGKPQVGTWLSLGSVVACRFLARTGLPWLTVDMEHSHADIQTAAMMFGAIADAGCVPLARVPHGRHDWIKMALDCGAMGIVAPMVMTARRPARSSPPASIRPGATAPSAAACTPSTSARSAEEYYARADDEILVILQAEHIDAVEIADEIYAVPGIDAIFVGPNDLAASLRGPDGSPPSKELHEATMQRILAACKRTERPRRPPRLLDRGREATDRRGLAVHRRQQRAEVHAPGRLRAGPPDPPGAAARGTRQVGRDREILDGTGTFDHDTPRLPRCFARPAPRGVLPAEVHIYSMDHETGRLIKIKEDGTLLWDCPNRNGHDVQLLPNGNVLIVTGEVQEITPGQVDRLASWGCRRSGSPSRPSGSRTGIPWSPTPTGWP